MPLEQRIEQLVNAINRLTEVLNAGSAPVAYVRGEKSPVPEKEVADAAKHLVEVVEKAEKKAPAATEEEVRKYGLLAINQLTAAGYKKLLVEQFGVESYHKLDKARWGELIAALKEAGVKETKK